MRSETNVPNLDLKKRISDLEGRLEQLESAIENLTLLFELEDSVLYMDQFTAQTIRKYKAEATNIKNTLGELNELKKISKV